MLAVGVSLDLEFGDWEEVGNGPEGLMDGAQAQVIVGDAFHDLAEPGAL
jgi:hypothetical protein